MRLYESNKQATLKALEHLYNELSELALTMYDYKLIVKDPV